MSAMVDTAATTTATATATLTPSSEEVDQAPVSSASASVSARYAKWREDELEPLTHSLDERAAVLKEAVVKFNVKPKSAREYLVAKKMIQVSE